MKDERFDTVEYIVEADDFAKLKLWEENHQQVDWKQDSSGLFESVGELDGLPIGVVVTFAVLNGHRIAFYECTTRMADHNLVEQWVKEQCPSGTPHTNAMNFHNVFLHVKGPADPGKPTEIGPDLRLTSDGTFQVRREVPVTKAMIKVCQVDSKTFMASWDPVGDNFSPTIVSGNTREEVISKMTDQLRKKLGLVQVVRESSIETVEIDL